MYSPLSLRWLAWWSPCFHIILHTRYGKTAPSSNISDQLLLRCGWSLLHFTIWGCSTGYLTGIPLPCSFSWLFVSILPAIFRLYHSSTSGTYKVVLNQLLPWQKKLVVPFRPSEISQVDLDKNGWKVGALVVLTFSPFSLLLLKVTGITKFDLLPVQRTLWLDRDSFQKAKDYWTLCGRRIGEWKWLTVKHCFLNNSVIKWVSGSVCECQCWHCVTERCCWPKDYVHATVCWAMLLLFCGHRSTFTRNLSSHLCPSISTQVQSSPFKKTPNLGGLKGRLQLSIKRCVWCWSIKLLLSHSS